MQNNSETPFDRNVVPVIKKIFKFIGKAVLTILFLSLLIKLIGFTFSNTTHFLIVAGIIAYIYIVLFKIKNGRVRSNIIVLTILPFAYIFIMLGTVIFGVAGVLFKNLGNPIFSGRMITPMDLYYELEKIANK